MPTWVIASTRSGPGTEVTRRRIRVRSRSPSVCATETSPPDAPVSAAAGAAGPNSSRRKSTKDSTRVLVIGTDARHRGPLGSAGPDWKESSTVDISLGPGPGGSVTAATRAVPATRAVRTARAGAWSVLIGTLITLVGLSWDIQWHIEVGPDTFFTLPHLFLYSGSAIAGFAQPGHGAADHLGAARRPGPAALAGGPPIRVFGGAFTRAPRLPGLRVGRGAVPALRPARPVVAFDLRLRRGAQHARRTWRCSCRSRSP